MTLEEEQQARERAFQFGLLATSLLLAASGSTALFYFLSLLKKKKPLEGPFDAVQAQARDTLQNDFEQIVTELAPLAKTDLDQWSYQMWQAISGYLEAQMVAAKGRALLPGEYLEWRSFILNQLDFLDGFTRHLRENEDRSEAYIIARARLYSGAGRALWYRIAEVDEPEGWVVDYISVDDDGTCSPCLDADVHGPYLFSQGPYPGEVCLGRGRCRCHRQPRYDLAEWTRLLSETEASVA